MGKPAKKTETKKPARRQRTYRAKQLEGPGIIGEYRYIDSLFGVKLFLQKDGRRRGLWLNLEEEINSRIEQDSRLFEKGMQEFEKWMAAEDGYKKEPKMLRFMLRSICFSYFFEHRTEGKGMRLTWTQVRNFIKALTEAEKTEKEKTEDDGFDPDAPENNYPDVDDDEDEDEE